MVWIRSSLKVFAGLKGNHRTERYNGLLDPEAVNLCMRRTKKLMQSLTRYLADVTKESVTFSEFIKWMSNSKYMAWRGEGV